MSDTLQYFLPDEAATRMLGDALAATQPGTAIVHLQGELGAGKSTLARAWLRALGVQGAIRSPTYTLVEHYPLPGGGKALHLDLYRIGDAGELEFLGLDDAGASLWLVEWPERRHCPRPTWRSCWRWPATGARPGCAPAPPGGVRGWTGCAWAVSCRPFLNRTRRKVRQVPDKQGKFVLQIAPGGD